MNHAYCNAKYNDKKLCWGLLYTQVYGLFDTKFYSLVYGIHSRHVSHPNKSAVVFCNQ
jgi:hypothetical protein